MRNYILKDGNTAAAKTVAKANHNAAVTKVALRRIAYQLASTIPVGDPRREHAFEFVADAHTPHLAAFISRMRTPGRS